MGLGRAIGNWFKSILSLFTGKVDGARAGLDSNPTVIKAKYDEIIRDKVKSIQQYKKAVAALVAQEEKKMQSLQQLTKDIERLETLKAGAAAKAKHRVAQMQAEGKSKDDIHSDPEYKKCLTAFNDFSSTLKEKQSHTVELEEDLAEYTRTISDHKSQLTSLMRSIDQLKQEANEAVAEVMTAKEEKEIGDLLSGISIDDKNAELSKLRDIRNKARAEAKISREMSGLETENDERAFIEYASREESSSEFDALIGLDETPQTDTPDLDTRLPE